MQNIYPTDCSVGLSNMTTDMKTVFSLLITTILLAGCTEALPEPGEIFGDCTYPDYQTLDGVQELDANESLNVTFGNDSALLQVKSYSYHAEHLVFTVDGNSIIFENLTYDVDYGYVSQEIDNQTVLVFIDDTKHLPAFGEASLVSPAFDKNMTLTYTVEFREWFGDECA